MTDTPQRVALITGGAQGIGRATTVRLLRDGWAVVMADIDEEAGHDALDEYRDLGPALWYVPTDAGDEEQVRRAVAETVARFGGLDLVMNNAYNTFYRPITEVTLEEWNRVVAVNLTGVFLTTKHAVPHLRERRGCIINIASTRALMGRPNADAYGATKGGVISLTYGLAMSLGPEIRVNCISPGWIDNYGWAKRSKRRPMQCTEERHSQHPAGRMGQPEDIAAMVAYLSSPDAGFITGENIVIDGGMTKKMIYV
ncbi:MAG: SDR family NAD(P)-dependent oxidoreductase [Armatimonadota bacterium]